MENRIVMLKIKEVPERFPGTTEHMIRKLVATGELRSVRVGKKFFIAESVITEFLLNGNNQTEQLQDKYSKLS